MKGYKIMGILWIIIAVCLTAILVLKLNGKTVKETLSITSNEISTTSNIINFEVSEINELDIDLASESIMVESTDGDKITVELYCSENNKPTVQLYKNVLKIESAHKPINIHFGDQKVVVKLPKNAVLSDVDLSSASGSIILANLNLQTLDCNSASGSINMSNCKISSLDAKSASGSINLNNTSIEVLDCSSKSGSINLTGNYEKIEAQSISGSLNVSSTTPLTGNSELQSTSGSIKLTVPKESNFTAKYSVISGIYKNEITGTSGKKGKEEIGNDGPEVELKTVSGSIHINN